MLESGFMRGLLGALTSTWLIACASGPTPSTSAPSTTGPEASDSRGPAANPPIGAQREAFMQSCMQTALSPDYCECGFEQFRIIFQDVDLDKKLPDDDPHLTKLRQQTLDVCASKLREEQVQANFIDGCVDHNEKKRAYCSCAWPALRRNLAVADFVLADFEGPRFLEAKKSMVTTCKGKFPASVAKSDFMTACTKDTTGEKVCECLWKKLKARFTMEELAAGTVDVSTAPGLAECHGPAPKAASNAGERNESSIAVALEE